MEQKQEIQAGNDIKSLILSKEAKMQFKTALPRHLSPDRFVRIALTAINRTPKLMSCTKQSVVQCLLDLSQLGLEPDGRKAHLIPYGNQCTLIIDYKGLVDLARRSGEIADIHADIVCENDIFEYSYGSDGKLIHKPSLLQDRGKVIAAYSFVRLKDNSSSYEVMKIDEIDAIRKRSKAKDNGPWKTDWNEMAKKTVFRRHSKWLPVESEKLQEAINKDYDVPLDIIDVNRVPNGKPEVEMPKRKSIEAPKGQKPNGDNAYKNMLEEFTAMKKALGEEKYYQILGNAGYEKSNQIRKISEGEKILNEMKAGFAK